MTVIQKVVTINPSWQDENIGTIQFDDYLNKIIQSHNADGWTISNIVKFEFSIILLFTKVST